MSGAYQTAKGATMSAKKPVYAIAKELGMSSGALVDHINQAGLGFTVKTHSNTLEPEAAQRVIDSIRKPKAAPAPAAVRRPARRAALTCNSNF